MAKPRHIRANEIHYVSVFICSFTRHHMREDTLGLMAPYDDAFDYHTGLSRFKELGLAFAICLVVELLALFHAFGG